jgi:hypothetical protein
MRHSLRPLSMLLTRGQCRIIRTAKNGRNSSYSDFTNATSRLEVAAPRVNSVIIWSDNDTLLLTV